MRATVDGIVYEGSVEEIRSIVENPPIRPCTRVTSDDQGSGVAYSCHDGTSVATCDTQETRNDDSKVANGICMRERFSQFLGM